MAPTRFANKRIGKRRDNARGARHQYWESGQHTKLWMENVLYIKPTAGEHRAASFHSLLDPFIPSQPCDKCTCVDGARYIHLVKVVKRSRWLAWLRESKPICMSEKSSYFNSPTVASNQININGLINFLLHCWSTVDQTFTPV